MKQNPNPFFYRVPTSNRQISDSPAQSDRQKHWHGKPLTLPPKFGSKRVDLSGPDTFVHPYAPTSCFIVLHSLTTGWMLL